MPPSWFAVAVGLFFVDRSASASRATVAAVVMAFTRVYVGAHYPGDVLAGLALGGGVAWLGHIVVVPVLRLVVLHVADSRLRSLVASHESKPGTVAAS